MRSARWPLGVAVLGFALFAATWAMRIPASQKPDLADRVVVSAPVQLLLAGGDRFLAANVESVRAVATTSDAADAVESNALFGIRARRVVSQLNPCHEDNYYMGNALLTWGGAVSEGTELLRRAIDCRAWDELPPFLYGFNQYYFLRNGEEARWALELAAGRSSKNAAVLHKSAIMIAAGEFRDDDAALEYLTRERDRSTDPKLRQMLDKRVGRLAGLIQLRTAQQRYEAQFGKPLTDPRALLEHGLLQSFPTDPMRLGYEFADGRFRLKEMKIAGMEKMR